MLMQDGELWAGEQGIQSSGAQFLSSLAVEIASHACTVTVPDSILL
jgi:hypothetical protein